MWPRASIESATRRSRSTSGSYAVTWWCVSAADGTLSVTIWRNMIPADAGTVSIAFVSSYCFFFLFFIIITMQYDKSFFLPFQRTARWSRRNSFRRPADPSIWATRRCIMNGEYHFFLLQCSFNYIFNARMTHNGNEIEFTFKCRQTLKSSS